jgi:hypothetical protein
MFKPATIMSASGYWDWSNDATGTVMPASAITLRTGIDPSGAAGTMKSLHVSGAMHTGWGAALAAELSNGCPFDASAYGGISFWAKGTSTVIEGANKLLIMVGMPEFIPIESSGFCNDTAMPPDVNCYARHRVLIDLVPDWKQYTIAWKDDTRATARRAAADARASAAVRSDCARATACVARAAARRCSPHCRPRN